MQAFLKRYFWLVNLLLLAGIAFLAALVFRNVVAGEIAALETHPAQKKMAAAGSGLGPINLASERAVTIRNRNLFNANPPDLEPEDDGMGGADGNAPSLPDGAIPGPGDECKKSDAPYNLKATMVAEPSDWSMAVLADSEVGDRLVKEGEILGDLILASIQRDRVVLAKGQSFECVSMGAKRIAKKSKRRGGRPRASSKAKQKIKDGVKKTGKHSYAIDRGMIDEQLEDMNTLMSQARVIPHYKNGKPQGFKLVGVRPGSLYSAIGIRSGDVIKSVNDEEIVTANKALELFDRLKTQNSVALEVERRGRKITLEYSIK